MLTQTAKRCSQGIPGHSRRWGLAHHVLKGILNGTNHQALVRDRFLQVKPRHSIVGDLPIVLCEGHLAQLHRAGPCVVQEADGRRRGVLQDVHKVPELLADVQVEPLGCHDSSTAACMAIKQGPVVEIKTLPALWGETGRFSKPVRKQMGRGIQSSWGHQLRTATWVFASSSQAPAQHGQERCGQLIKDVWTRPVPGSSPALCQTPHAASSASPAAGSSKGEARQGQHGSHLRSPLRHTGQLPPQASQPQHRPVRTMAGAGREQGQPVWDPRESLGRRWCAHIATCPISCPATGHPPCHVPACTRHPGSHPIQLPAAFPGWQPAPWAGPPLHKHHLAARLVLVVLALPRIYHPARGKQGIKALSFTPCSSRGQPAAPHPLPQPPFVPPHPPGGSLQCSCPVWGGGRSQARRHPRPVAGVDLGPAAVFTLTSTAGSRGKQPSRHSPRELTRKSRGFCCRSLALPQAQQLPENLLQPQRTHTQPGLRDTQQRDYSLIHVPSHPAPLQESRCLREEREKAMKMKPAELLQKDSR